MARPALFVFAKAPVAGAVKTRLQSVYTPAQAADIAAVLIRETLALAVANWDGPVYLAATPITTHPLFNELAERYAIPVRAQVGSDLGACMHDAIEYGITHHGAAAILGCDVPHCPSATLVAGHRWLSEGRNVFGPATDGGYYFVGVTRPYPELFADISWGSADVWAVTCERARTLGLSYESLPLLRDIDTADDLRLAAFEVSALRQFMT